LGAFSPNPKEIKVAGGAVGRRRPQAEQHRTLQDKPFPTRRDAQAVERALDSIPRHQKLGILTTFPGALSQPVAYGDVDILRGLHETIASM
jgi:hypothetical protein